ncbi:MAG: 17 kDa unknown protein [Cirsium cytorhabdovirus 1]|nr:MAG: 17 kDa unknown protein [Cirsium cytorhabdovirus 1]
MIDILFEIYIYSLSLISRIGQTIWHSTLLSLTEKVCLTSLILLIILTIPLSIMRTLLKLLLVLRRML